MNKLNSLSLLLIIFIQACAHVSLQNKQLNIAQKSQLYENINKEIKNIHANHLKECNCMKAFYRDLLSSPDDSARYIFDNKVGEHAIEQSKGKNYVSVLAIGSGLLLNELTAFGNILARGKNVKIYLTDWNYLFYGDDKYQEKALNLGNNPELIPDNWKDFSFWAWAKNKEEPYLPFFEKHHLAIDEFKMIIKKLDQIYNTQSSIEVIKPLAEQTVILPPLDMIIAIDAFLDIPNLIWTLVYQNKLINSPVCFLALNKTKPLGGFYDSNDLTKRENNSKKPVSIDIYNVTSSYDFGSYQLIERIIFEPSQEQIKKAPEFIINPKRDSNQSPLDIQK